MTGPFAAHGGETAIAPRSAQAAAKSQGLVLLLDNGLPAFGMNPTIGQCAPFDRRLVRERGYLLPTHSKGTVLRGQFVGTWFSLLICSRSEATCAPAIDLPLITTRSISWIECLDRLPGRVQRKDPARCRPKSSHRLDKTNLPILWWYETGRKRKDCV